MHAKTTVLRCTESGQTISRQPPVGQDDGERVNNLRNVIKSAFHVNERLVLIAVLIPLSVGRVSWKQMRPVMLRKQHQNPKGGNCSEIFALLISDGGLIS